MNKVKFTMHIFRLQNSIAKSSCDTNILYLGHSQLFHWFHCSIALQHLAVIFDKHTNSAMRRVFDLDFFLFSVSIKEERLSIQLLFYLS